MDVRTSHPQLAQQLRQELPELMRTLEINGYRSEIAQPGSAEPARTIDALAADAAPAGRMSPVSRAGTDTSFDADTRNGGETSRNFDDENQSGRRHRRPLKEEEYEY
jgi:hypothetical protein